MDSLITTSLNDHTQLLSGHLVKDLYYSDPALKPSQHFTASFFRMENTPYPKAAEQ